MSKLDSNDSKEYVEGKEEDYVDRVCVFLDAEAVRPGSTKIRDISVKLVMVHCLNLIYYAFTL